MTNKEIILRAMLTAEIITSEDVKNGNIPEVHTYDVWKENGRTVKRGARAMFSAMIWKFTKKNHRLTAEEAQAMSEATGEPHNAGDSVEYDGYILKRAHFFGLEQTEETAAEVVIEIPADCTRTTENGCEWISGNTRAIKEQLKAAGYRFSRRRGAWYKFTSQDVERQEPQAEPAQLGIFTDSDVDNSTPGEVTELNEGDKIMFLEDMFGITAGTVKTVDSYDGFQLWFRDDGRVSEGIIGFFPESFGKLRKVS